MNILFFYESLLFIFDGGLVYLSYCRFGGNARRPLFTPVDHHKRIFDIHCDSDVKTFSIVVSHYVQCSAVQQGETNNTTAVLLT